MSAYVVDRETVDVLVAAGAQLAQASDPTHLSRVGQALLTECVRSVSYRYSDDDLGELPGSYDIETIPGSSDTIRIAQWLMPYEHRTPDRIDREIVADAIGNYEYQSCEHPEWEQSWARGFCIALRAQLANLPDAPAPEPEPRLDPDEFRAIYGDLSRNETIKRIRVALKRRSGKSWSVTGGRGTGWGWINISAPPRRLTGAHVQKPDAPIGEYEHVDTGVPQQFGIMTPQDCAELAELLGKDRVHPQGESVPSSSDYYREYIDRAEGRSPVKFGTQYWD